MRSVTPDDIRREHDAAIASLTSDQRHSFRRQRQARQMMNFNGLSDRQNLQMLFEREATQRNADAELLDAEARERYADCLRADAERTRVASCAVAALMASEGAQP